MAYSIDGEITLIKKTATGRDARGFPVYGEARRLILAKVESAPQSEYFQAGQVGIQSEYVFIINPIEYQGERLAEYQGEQYRIYRRYHRDMDELEIYAGKELGSE